MWRVCVVNTTRGRNVQGSLEALPGIGNKSEPPYTLEALGLAAAALGDVKHSGPSLGRGGVWREAINEPLPPTFQRDYAKSMTQARTQLGEEVYASAWSEGHAMSPEQAIALALEE